MKSTPVKMIMNSKMNKAKIFHLKAPQTLDFTSKYSIKMCKTFLKILISTKFQINSELLERDLVVTIRIYVSKDLFDFPLICLFQQFFQLFPRYEPCPVLINIIESLFEGLLCEQFTLFYHGHNKFVEVNFS